MGRIKTALQHEGGAAMGAVAAGWLDADLENFAQSDPAPTDLPFDVLSGTSAGAVNNTLMAVGLAHGGPPLARYALHHFWHGEELRRGILWNSFSFHRWMSTAPMPPIFANMMTQAVEVSGEVMARQHFNAHVDYGMPWQGAPNIMGQQLTATIEAIKRHAKTPKFPKPVATVNAVDVHTMREQHLRLNGNVEEAVAFAAGSAALAPYFAPVQVGDAALVDGIFASNAPTAAVQTEIANCDQVVHLRLSGAKTEAFYRRRLASDAPDGTYGQLLKMYHADDAAAHPHAAHPPHGKPVIEIVFEEPPASQLHIKFMPTPQEIARLYERGRQARIEFARFMAANPQPDAAGVIRFVVPYDQHPTRGLKTPQTSALATAACA